MSERSDKSTSGLSGETAALVGLIQEKVIRPFNIPEKAVLEPANSFIQEIYDNFYTNIQSCVALASILYDVCSHFEQETHFRRHHASERILQLAEAARAGEIKYDLDEAMEEAARTRAIKKTQESLSDTDSAVTAILSRILHLVEHLDFGKQADNLTRQSMVLLWTSFESFCRELLRTILNERPNLYRRLAISQDFRKEIRSIDLETLEENNFDVSNALGDILILNRDMSSSKAIAKAFVAMLPESQSIGRALASRDLYVLGRIRNVIVHNGGIVDTAFAKSTGQPEAVGALLRFGTYDFGKYVRCVVDSAGVIATEASRELREHLR